VHRILEEGAEKARMAAEVNLREIKKIMKLYK
jgi:hypothetical protein